MTKSEFIKQIAAAAQKYAPKYGIKVVSPVIAQACLESGYGTSNKAKYHNYFGLKYRKNRVTCNSGYFSDGSQEQKSDGTYVPITTDWYAFDSLEKGVEGYFQFINISTYANLKGVTDPHQYLVNIRADGYATSLSYVDNVYKVIVNNNLTQYDTNSSKEEKKEENKVMGYTNSSLVNCKVMSPNHSGKRTHSIDRITPHCVVGQLSAESIGGCFPSGRQASCNYGIGYDGRVCLVVDEANRSWCSSSAANDQRAITIEVASDKSEPYAFKEAAYNKLIDLCADICKRNGKNKLLWISDKNTALNYSPKSNEMVLTVHRWFANKSCPGNWMYSRMGDLANKVNAKLGTSGGVVKQEETPASNPKPNKNFPAVPFTVKVLVSDLNYRSKASMDGAVKGTTGKGKFTITQVSNGWGKLKSGAGWIYLENASYVSIGKTVGGSGSNTSTPANNNTSYIVKVTTDALNIRKGPGTNYAVAGCIKDKGRYTIVQEQNGWGKLKSGAGWISLQYTKKV